MASHNRVFHQYVPQEGRVVAMSHADQRDKSRLRQPSSDSMFYDAVPNQQDSRPIAVRPTKTISFDNWDEDEYPETLLSVSPESPGMLNVRLPTGTRRSMPHDPFNIARGRRLSRSQSARSEPPLPRTRELPTMPKSPQHRSVSRGRKQQSNRQSDPGTAEQQRTRSASRNPRLKKLMTERDLDDINTGRRSGEMSRLSIKNTPVELYGQRTGRPKIDSGTLPPPLLRHSIEAKHRKKISAESYPSPVHLSNWTTSHYEEDIWSRSRYLAGAIQVEPSFGLYAIPVMTAMDVLCQSETINDDQVIDEIVDFFKSYGFEPVASELDQYWMQERAVEPKRISKATTTSSSLPKSVKSPTGFSDTSSVTSHLHPGSASEKRWSGGQQSAISAEGAASHKSSFDSQRSTSVDPVLLLKQSPAPSGSAALPTTSPKSPGGQSQEEDGSPGPGPMLNQNLKVGKQSPAPKSALPSLQSRSKFSIRRILANRNSK
ncbi:hypothetical protein BT63DRAFT_408759 [Microthyrium microscopicum]|uniref:Uncharacterized protein n=1 Tax=Microthyrium microscopicum TaxID=703497 RepID=A0A6A6UUH3_9PEZI|nr:hypothetical protein BT63DRAFT_408759 [Microthyrium microscopicum]